MAKEQRDDGASKEDNETIKPGALGRRTFLKATGTSALALATVGGTTGNVLGASYETVTVPAGERRSFSVGSGETLSNLLIDVTADGADVRITASGDDWTIENVGVRGTFDVGADSGGYSNVMRLQGRGTVDSVYLGDGVESNVRKGAIGVPHTHAAHISVSRAYVGGWSANAVYAAGAARIREPGKTDGAGGSIGFEDSYFRDNNIAHLRIAADGSYVRNCVLENSGNVPAHPNTRSGDSGVVYSRGIYTGYGDPEQVVAVEDCHIDITSANTNGGASAVVSGTHGTYGELSTVRVRNTEIRGDVDGNNVSLSSVGSSPDTSLPAGVPADAVAAASGETDSDGDEDDGADTSILAISGGSPTNRLEYSFSVSDTVTKSTAAGGSISDEDTISGSSVEGLVAGGTDSYEVVGEITSFTGDSGLNVSLDGQAVNPDELGTGEEPSDDDGQADDGQTDEDQTDDDQSDDSGSDDTSYDTLVINGTKNSEETAYYRFTVSGEVTYNESRSSVVDGGLPWDSMVDVVDGNEAIGIVGNGVDAFDFSGRLTGITINGDATFTIIRS